MYFSRIFREIIYFSRMEYYNNSVHYFAIFACYFDEATQKRKTPLLAVSPLQDEESLTAATHYEFIIGTLGLYGKSLSCVLGLVADNENLKKALARVLKVPMVGCASHRLNLAVSMFMNNYEDLLDKIHATMLKMSSLKKSGSLRKLTPLRPVLKNKTR